MNFKILMGNSNSLSSLPINNGYLYYIKDKNVFYIDYENQRIKINAENLLPTVSSDDNGKFLQVVDGVWTANLIPNAEGESF